MTLTAAAIEVLPEATFGGVLVVGTSDETPLNPKMGEIREKHANMNCDINPK